MKSDAARVDIVKVKIAPWLDEPYFQVVPKYMTMEQKRCMHENEGVRIDEIERRCYCRGCGLQVDPFIALLHYAASEQRQISARKAIEDAQQSEQARKQREKDRRPFARKVTGFTARKDLSLKAEPVIGYTLSLECGHKKDCGPNRKPKRVTCRECATQARLTSRAKL